MSKVQQSKKNQTPLQKKSSTLHNSQKMKLLQRRVISGFLPGQIQNIALLILASVLFAAVFPSPVFQYGISFLVSFALIPVAILLQRIRQITSLAWGWAYGFLAYFLFNFWLGNFSPVSFLIVPPIYGTYFLVVFFLLKLATKYFPKYGFVVQSLIWLLYEYARTKGFLGYSFGVLGYAWSFSPFWIQSADIFGVWGITLYIAMSSFFLAQLFFDCNLQSKIQRDSTEEYQVFAPKNIYKICIQVLSRKHYKLFLIAYALATLFIISYGALSPKDYSESDTVRMSLVQHARDPWKGGFLAYKKSLDDLISESRALLDGENPPEVVVWSETAFVPSIRYHLKYREIPEYTRLIRELYAFLEEYPDTEFIIGNGEGVKKKNKNGVLKRENYNASLFYRGDQRIDSYYKIHLVPFTEYFPYDKELPRFYEFLKKYDVHFWLEGDEYTVFEGKKAKYSTPICFEDGFGLLNAKFIRAGADILVNITNDAWSGVENNAMQHFQLSIMRAVENRRSLVRSTNSGMTASVDPNGQITGILESFKTATLTRDIPVYNSYGSIYTKYGDWFVVLIGLIVIILILSKLYSRIRKKSHS